MRWTSQASACLVAVALVGCGGGRDRQNGGAAGSGNETGTMADSSGMSGSMGTSDTSGTSGMSGSMGTSDTSSTSGTSGMSDTGRTDAARTGSAASGSRMRSDSAKANQAENGVTNTKTGKSTLGPGVNKTRPDQGQPVTSKGDTVNPGMDSTQQ